MDKARTFSRASARSRACSRSALVALGSSAVARWMPLTYRWPSRGRAASSRHSCSCSGVTEKASGGIQDRFSGVAALSAARAHKKAIWQPRLGPADGHGTGAGRRLRGRWVITEAVPWPTSGRVAVGCPGRGLGRGYSPWRFGGLAPVGGRKPAEGQRVTGAGAVRQRPRFLADSLPLGGLVLGGPPDGLLDRTRAARP